MLRCDTWIDTMPVLFHLCLLHLFLLFHSILGEAKLVDPFLKKSISRDLIVAITQTIYDQVSSWRHVPSTWVRSPLFSLILPRFFFLLSFFNSCILYSTRNERLSQHYDWNIIRNYSKSLRHVLLLQVLSLMTFSCSRRGPCGHWSRTRMATGQMQKDSILYIDCPLQSLYDHSRTPLQGPLIWQAKKHPTVS